MNSNAPEIPEHTGPSGHDEHDLLVISDLHLGGAISGIGDQKSEDTIALERGLCTFLEHHRGDGRPWRLVINGDMIDLVGLTMMPEETGCVTGLHPDDHTYGLGAQAHTALLKLERVLAYHHEVFRALARFVAEGHPLVVVIGNHDIELHFPEAQELFVESLVRLADLGSEDEQDEMRARIAFHDWFFLSEGLAWIEHGHQYDPYCSFEDVLEPATDEREIDPNVGALLLRYVQTQFVEEIHEIWGKSYFGYLHLWFRQGRERIASIGRAYVAVIRRLVEHWSARLPERIAARRARAGERLRRLAHRVRLSEDLLRELMALRPPPITVDLWRIIQALMIDRLSLMLLGPLLAFAPLLLAPWSWMPWVFTASLVPFGFWGWAAAMAREPTDPSVSMRAHARKIRALARVPIVVMGHSHKPESQSDNDGWYFNTGAWAEPALGFTHVRIHRTTLGAHAVLCRWRDGVATAYETAGLGALATVPDRAR